MRISSGRSARDLRSSLPTPFGADCVVAGEGVRAVLEIYWLSNSQRANGQMEPRPLSGPRFTSNLGHSAPPMNLKRHYGFLFSVRASREEEPIVATSTSIAPQFRK